MFNLNKAVTQWCMKLKVTGFASEEEVIELRDHLESDIDQLTNSGHSEKEAFCIASEKMGSVQALSREYFKAGFISRLARYPLPLKLTIFILFLAGVLGLTRLITVMLIDTGVITNVVPEGLIQTAFNYPVFAIRAFMTFSFFVTAVQLIRLKKNWLYAARIIFALFTITLLGAVISNSYQLLTGSVTTSYIDSGEIVSVTISYISDLLELGSLLFSLIIAVIGLWALFSDRVNYLFTLPQSEIST